MATNNTAVIHIPIMGWRTPLKNTSSPNPAQKLTKKMSEVSISKVLISCWYFVKTELINFIEIIFHPTQPKSSPETIPTIHSIARLVFDEKRLKKEDSKVKKWITKPKRGNPINVPIAKGRIDFLII